MTTIELKQILQEIKDDCQDKLCKECEYLNNDTLTCRLNSVPAEWHLEDRFGRK